MNSVYHLKNGRVIDPASGRDDLGDVFIVGDRIAGALSEEQHENATVIDAGGQVVCPGFIDLHCHLREPGEKHKECVATGTAAAARGGFTTLLCMPNTNPAADNPGTLQQIIDAIHRDAVVHVYPSGCMTQGRTGETLAPMGSLKRAGARAVTDSPNCIQNNELMRRATEYAATFGLAVLDNCEDAHLARNAMMHEGEWSLRLGLRGMHRAAEDIIVSRNVILAHHIGASIHLQALSSAYSVETIARAKERGVAITAEVTPHHLTLTDEDLRDYDTNCKVLPPLRGASDREALRQGLANGTIDCIASGHAPHSPMEKDCEFDFAPFGINSLETTLSICLENLVETGVLGLAQLIEKLTVAPAKILGLDAGTLTEGALADITIFDPAAAWTAAPEAFASRSHNSPWLNQRLRGRPTHTFVDGRLVFRDPFRTSAHG